MRLTQINLAGFKSFVDPTHIPVPSQLVGIVGPNGCGKSNVIDAVRWVLGETSAKHLRGETMQDVLFNGSGQRKPVNRASVELIFDNSLGKAAGQWSKYAEISIKRVLQREGDSSYYINNMHVRRRDIADIFLGTGLGARAYAIIEQGMISRVIEAKPEDLRIFLEEAAGVSRYRERRRETELKLRDTRENLLRVEDIRQELEKQLSHLAEQAEVAKRYNTLQAELSTTQGLLWLTRRQEAAASRARYAREIERLGIELEAETAKLREAEKRLESLRDEHYRAGDSVHAAQGALYESNAEVARLELEINHARDNRQRIEQSVANLTAQIAHGESQVAAAQTNLEEWRGLNADAHALLAQSEASLAQEAEKLPVAEEAYRASHVRREEIQHALSQAAQAREVESTKLDHAGRTLEQLAIREERLRDEQAHLPQADDAALVRLNEERQQMRGAMEAQRSDVASKETSLTHLEQRLRGEIEALDSANLRVTALEARRHALVQLQERIAHGQELEGWLAERNLENAPRLWQGIDIEEGTELALEAVLRERLNGLALDDIGEAAQRLRGVPPGKMTVFEASTDAATEPMVEGLTPLQRFVTCRDTRLKGAMSEWLHQVYVVDDAGQAVAMRVRLPHGAMLVTREGHIYMRHSVSFHAPDSELHGVVSRRREIEELEAESRGAREVAVTAQSAVTATEEAIARVKSELAVLRASVADTQTRHHAIDIEVLRLTEEARRLTQRGEQIAQELSEIHVLAETERTSRDEASARLVRLTQEYGEHAGALELATELYARADSMLELQRETLQKARHEQQAALFEARAAEAKIAEIESGIRLLTERAAALTASLASEQAALVQCDETVWQAQLQQALTQKTQREQVLAGARDALEGMESRLREIEQERLVAEQRLDPLRERVNEVRMKEQEARLVEEQYAQQLADSGADQEMLRGLLEKGMRSGTMQAEIARLNDEIRALGAVNLAALEELQTAQERKTYLDAQSADLTEAMTTLEDAIRRIDRETRERLQKTFEEVNAHFSRMFPALFGGGNAKLVMTGEEILDCGVQVFAQPPGKKNTTIHLLSGGEKALTALSLVFSMFQLNPAPFCLLDEVDAPLDDHNTGRFCDLVKKMSETSQFLFISHNKITMEIAHQLLGITMQEPGVSRVVAVDIEEAMKLTEEAA